MDDEIRNLLRRTADLAAGHLESLADQPIRVTQEAQALRLTLGGPLAEAGQDPWTVVEGLAAAAEPGLVRMGSGRYFGFVIGGALPAALAADWLTSAWDQNAGLYVGGPAASVVEDTVGAWTKELLGLPGSASFALVTGCQMAHTTCLATARHALLANQGWDVEAKGLRQSPPVRILAGDRAHVTIQRSLRLLGLGRDTVETVPTDPQGRIRVDAVVTALAASTVPAILCVQAGEVNSGAFDDLEALAEAAQKAGAWLHVDGAFGLWAAASASHRHLVKGLERADSWATDAHKVLNVPYDCGLAFTAHPRFHRAAMGVQADYLVHDQEGVQRDQVDWTPDFSRRARAFPVYAALRSLGRTGVAELVQRLCRHAQAFAAGLDRLPDCERLNEVAFNQVLFRFADDARTDRILARVQAEGEAWMSGTSWGGRRAIRISVCNWRTSEADVARTMEAFRSAARA